MKEKLTNLVNAAYTLLTLALLFLIINYFGKFLDIPSSVVIITLILSALVFAARMYLKFSSRR